MTFPWLRIAVCVWLRKVAGGDAVPQDFTPFKRAVLFTAFSLVQKLGSGLRCPEKVLWLLLAENHDSRKHKVLSYDSLQIWGYYTYNLRACVHLPVQVCTKAYQYITILAKLLC